MAELNVQQQNIIKQLKEAYPELKNYTDEQILSLYNQQLNNIQLSEDERISIMNGRNGISNDGMGLRLEGTQTSVSKEQESQLKSALTARLNAVSTNIKKAEDSNGGIASLWSGIKNITGWGDSSNKVREQQKADLKALQGGNITEAFKQITGLDYTVENVNKFLNNEVQTKSETALNGYTEGQEMALDVGADMVSGILAVGALALAPVTGGASILIAAGVGAATKVTIKALAPGEYLMRDLAYDSITGSINGALAPITNGLGGAAGTGIAKFFGLEALESTAKTALSQAVKHAGKEVVEEVVEETVEQSGKNLLTRILAKQGSEYVLKEGAEKTLKTSVGKVAAYTADLMVDGSLSGAGDGFARALAEGRFEDIPQDMLQGFIGGVIASPFIGGGFRLVGKASSTVLNKINNKITFSSVLPDGTSTKFGQGQVGDCPLLSMIDGFLANDRTKGLLTNAIQTDANGNFAVKIGDKTVTVLRSSLTDEMLSDQSGIRIFEQAYKQIAGDLDGGFADVVAKHFGLNPLHITSDNITDEVLEKIANDSDNYVLSLGARINSDGVVTPDGEFQHYFSIKNIDPKTKTVTLVDTYDTSKTLTMSFDDIKTQGISIDGGSVGKTELPNSVRNTDDVKFRGGDEYKIKDLSDEEVKNIINNFKLNENEKESFFETFNEYKHKINQYNVQVLDMLLEDKGLSWLKYICLQGFGINIKTATDAEKFIKLIRIIQNNAKLYEYFSDSNTGLYYGLCSLTPENVNLYSEILSNHKINQNLSMLEGFSKYCSFFESNNNLGFLLEQINSNENFYNYIKTNPTLLENLVFLSSSAETKIILEMLIDKNLYKNESLCKFLDFTQENCISHTDAELPAKFNKIGYIVLNDDELINDKNFLNVFMDKISNRVFSMEEDIEEIWSYFINKYKKAKANGDIQSENIALNELKADLDNFYNYLLHKNTSLYAEFIKNDSFEKNQKLNQWIEEYIKKENTYHAYEVKKILKYLTSNVDNDTIKDCEYLAGVMQFISKSSSFDKSVDFFINTYEKMLSKGYSFDKTAELISQMAYTTEHKVQQTFIQKIFLDTDLYKFIEFDILKKIISCVSKQNITSAIDLCTNYKKLELLPEQLPFLIKNAAIIKPKQLQKLTRIVGRSNVAKLTDSDLVIACQVADLYDKTNINEIPIEGKKEALRALVACNEGLFNISPEMQKMFPMLPTNRDAYCSLLPSIVRSLGIETNTLTTVQTSKFNQSLTDLSGSLAKISDADFADLRITQEYSKDDFITNVLKIVKELPVKERQKVYDYFGFELHHNKGNQTGFSITGYPVNLNNGKKLAQIIDPRTKEIVELLRPEVIKFSEQNPIKCKNPQIEQLLNDVVDALPELRAQIGKTQHSTHNFDILQHSLKVMQKISQDPKFKELNESDQKVMMLASLLHDITKREGNIDKTHANESAFDTFFIAKKFNLSREEEIKLYTLARHHEWLEYVNTSKSEEQLTKRLQSVAYDLQNDNLFDMALMFTHADLRAVKVDDTFHDTTIGSGRKAFDGTVRSYGESADVYAQRIQNYIQELQKSQPLLPVTKIPTASKITEAITVVRSDGSTNIKGVYKDKDGLIVIKYNEVEDWEAIGFPEGSISRGIKAQKGEIYGGEEVIENINTGNIHFFTHGLDYENQLAKFDAFGLVNSDALLSISYAERPESKYRFFRAQGVLLDFDTKYVHGGGNKDSGSGLGKSIADFKKNYIFGGNREFERHYVSKIIKDATGMNDVEYARFIKENENKSFIEIEPIELREKIIKTLASINSNKRKGARSYNEMYGSNPNRVMGVFAYNIDYNENIGNPIEFLNRTTISPNEHRSFGNAPIKSVSERTEFLRRYALEHNVPFVVFGD